MDMISHESSDTTISPIDALQPGDVVTFDNMDQLVAFEDYIVAVVKPDFDPDKWASRMPLKSHFVIPDFRGSMQNIELTALEDPIQAYKTTSERGYKGRFGAKLSTEKEELFGPHFRGFAFMANAVSSGIGTVGQIRAEMYYYPVTLPTHTVVATRDGQEGPFLWPTSKKLSSKHSLSGIGRVILPAIYDRSRFTAVDERSRHIAFTVLRYNIAHPFGGMHE